MNKYSLDYILQEISNKNTLHAKKIRTNISALDNEFKIWAEQFLMDLAIALPKLNYTIDQCIDFYLERVSKNMMEMVNFLRTGQYRYSSFDEVNRNIYNNSKAMQLNMMSLLLSQLLWKQHYETFTFFKSQLKQYQDAKNYLEIGGGHGLYLNEATKAMKAKYSLIDISPTSINIAKTFNKDNEVNYILSDIFDYKPTQRFDFISMGEVLEHVEKPNELLLKIKEYLAPNGTLFITVPTNSPEEDHIYLFNNSNEIRELITDVGFEIKSEQEIPTENITAEKAHKKKICVIYAAFITSK